MSTETALPAKPAERVRVILERVVEALDVDADVEVSESDEEISARVEGDDLGVVIGRRGHTIDAIQLVCYRAAFAGSGERKRVMVDAAGYREERREAVERQAGRAAERALESGKEIELEAMSSTERRIVHQHRRTAAGSRRSARAPSPSAASSSPPWSRIDGAPARPGAGGPPVAGARAGAPGRRPSLAHVGPRPGGGPERPRRRLARGPRGA